MLATEELKHYNPKELENELQKAEFDLYKLKLAVSSRQSNETAKLKLLRRYIARIKTIKRMLKIEQPKENPKSQVTK